MSLSMVNNHHVESLVWYCLSNLMDTTLGSLQIPPEWDVRVPRASARGLHAALWFLGKVWAASSV